PGSCTAAWASCVMRRWRRATACPTAGTPCGWNRCRLIPLDRRGRITRRGLALLRKLLVECAWVMLRYNSWARAAYQRLSRGKARKKQAIVALARKLLVRCWAMLRDRTPWRDDAPTPAAAAP